MKVILLQDVPKVGRKYEIKNVADGFARNVLLVQKKAVIATPAEVARIDKLKADQTQASAQKNAALEKLVADLNQSNLTIKAKANDEGQLFAALPVSEIIKAIKDQGGVEVGEKDLEISQPIKKVGEHVLKIKMSSGQTQNSSREIKLQVVKL